jgi:hypothetical protein
MTARATRHWWGHLSLPLLGLLLLIRLPAFVEPTGNDQNIYMYVADRVRAGEVPYLDAWDQKPPAIFAVYAGLRSVWPRPSAVALADTVAAGLTAWALVRLGGRIGGGSLGRLAAATFLLFGHPSLARLSGVYIRGQCETFIALATTAALLAIWSVDRSRWRLVASGVCLGLAFWLKYNAIAYALPAVAAVLVGPRAAPASARVRLEELLWVATGFLAVATLTLSYFAAHGALGALRLATLDYNLRYSAETYTMGLVGGVAHFVALPLARARVDMLWFLGGAGALFLGFRGLRRARPVALLTGTWLLASVVSIAVNGARDLPQYFVQAGPVLAFAWAAGAQLAWEGGRVWRTVIAVVLTAGLWRVGVEAPSFADIRLGGLPDLARNLAFDLRYLTGSLERRTYLARFAGAQKYDALEISSLADYVRSTTSPSDRILVFGFAPGVYVEGERQSASRFFWSRPVILEFASERSDYGSAGLLDDLHAVAPAVVALQKQDWRPDVANSAEFFLAQPALRDWLVSGYTLDRDTAVFSVWRRNPE